MSRSEERRLKAMMTVTIHCENCGGFAHVPITAVEGMDSGTILPPCDEPGCGKRMTVLLCAEGEYQEVLAALAQSRRDRRQVE